MAKEIAKGDFEQKVLKADKPVLVDFYAPWCGPCQMMSPVIEELAKEFADKAYVYKVNIDEEHDLANEFQVMSIPTMFVFRDGKISKQFNAVTEKDDIAKELSK